jgi:FlaA1/EpsC-like NDP-sugar epimerase
MTHGDGKTAFEGKRILITGGTGSLGKVLARRILSGEWGRPARMTILSRDEAKQYDMRLAFQHLQAATEEIIYKDSDKILHFRIGDVRDYFSIANALRDVDVVFNAAALKQVPSCEYFPYEAVQTNIEGPENIVRAIENMSLPVETVVGVSTDKACKPVNVMGMTKAIQERVFISGNLRTPNTRFICVRYGNVLASRGSVVPLFHSQIKAGGPVTITTNEMTRFLLSLNRAVDTIVDAYRLGHRGELFIPRVPASRITTVAKALIGDRNIKMVEVGIRPGEKVHEILVAEDEVYRTVSRDRYYVVRPLLPEIGELRTTEPAIKEEYSSKSEIMNVEETHAVLKANSLLVEDNPDFTKMFG